MKINNRKKAGNLKKVFFLVSVLIAIAALLFFLLDILGGALISIGIFSLWYLYFHVADYQYIEYSQENGKILLRYFKAISLGRVKYNEIEFSQNVLRKAVFEDSVFGKMSDLILVIKTKRGIAEYPSVSLSAVKKDDRQKIADSLNNLL